MQRQFTLLEGSSGAKVLVETLSCKKLIAFARLAEILLMLLEVRISWDSRVTPDS
jgi:hypothetical protein